MPTHKRLMISICRGVRFSFQFKFTLVTFLSFPGSAVAKTLLLPVSDAIEDRSKVGKELSPISAC